MLFETAKAKFFDEYLEKLKEVTDVHKIGLSCGQPHGAGPTRGSVEMLLDLSPQMKIIATGCALGFLKEIVNKDFVGIPARDRGKDDDRQPHAPVPVCPEPPLAGYHVHIYRRRTDPCDM